MSGRILGWTAGITVAVALSIGESVILYAKIDVSQGWFKFENAVAITQPIEHWLFDKLLKKAAVFRGPV